jgi:hypothetical protein
MLSAPIAQQVVTAVPNDLLIHDCKFLVDIRFENNTGFAICHWSNVLWMVARSFGLKSSLGRVTFKKNISNPKEYEKPGAGTEPGQHDDRGCHDLCVVLLTLTILHLCVGL